MSVVLIVVVDVAPYLVKTCLASEEDCRPQNCTVVVLCRKYAVLSIKRDVETLC